MDLMTLAAKLTLDDSSYKKGISNAESQAQNFTKRLSALTVAAGNIISDVAMKGISSITGAIQGAIDGYANYQQLIGGVETLFKSSSNKVAEYAKQSFKTTGLSANSYMETVTSFSASLLQGLNGDTDAAADLANTAITDMADNANKMGTNINSIQMAYQGFAKQNYTMLDNLKLGYGGTKNEMVRLINDSGILEHEIKNLDGITFDQLIQAIHVIQQQLGITGTTAAEAAGTISGSKSSIAAAWQDLLSAVGGEGGEERLNETLENFKTSFSTYIEKNLAPQIKTTIENAPALVDAVSDAITSLPSKAISSLAGSGVDLLTSTVEGATQIGGWLIDGLVGLFKDVNANQSKIADLGNAVGSFIGSALSDIVTGAPTIISGLFTAGVSLAGSLVEGLFSGLFGADEGVYSVLRNADKDLSDAIKDAETSSTKATGILNYMDQLIDKYGKAASGTQEWKDAEAALEEVLPGAGQVIFGYGSNIDYAVGKLREMNEETKKTAIEQAKQQALASKQQAWVDAQANLFGAQSQIQILQSEVDNARQNLIEFIQSHGQPGYTGEGADWEHIRDAAYAQLNESIGAGNEGYSEAAASLSAWIGTMQNGEEEINTLKGSLAGLEENVRFAEVSYLTSSAAIDDLTGAASGAAEALQAIKTPSVTFGSGDYYNWYYGGGNYQPRAVGIDYVPYDGFKSLLHRGEAVLTREEADDYRNGAGTSEIVGAIQEMRNDLQNLRLVVGQKTFGRAVVDYGARRMRDYIGETENRVDAGYGT